MRVLSLLVVAAVAAVACARSFDRKVARRPECMHPMDAGRCRALHRRWYWSTAEQRCLPFFFGGCFSNGNEFKTIQLCQMTCQPVEPCAKGFFECSNRRCIPMSRRCDGHMDCLDNNDEMGCNSTKPTTAPPAEQPVATKAPAKPKPLTEWRLRKWGACYADKNGATCGPSSGQQKRRRVCYIVGTPTKMKPKHCSGPRFETRPCQYKKCAVNGGFGNWTKWSQCSATCGKAKQTRTRSCDSPAPKHGGLPCQGHTIDKRFCKLPECPHKKRNSMCDRRPCQNGGTCIPNGRGFVCNCPETHYGAICHILKPGVTVSPVQIQTEKAVPKATPAVETMATTERRSANPVEAARRLMQHYFCKSNIVVIGRFKSRTAVRILKVIKTDEAPLLQKLPVQLELPRSQAPAHEHKRIIFIKTSNTEPRYLVTNIAAMNLRPVVESIDCPQ